jgi:hypothetical protein
MKKSNSKKLIFITLSILLLLFLILLYKYTYKVSGTPVTDSVVFSDAMAWSDILKYDYNGYDYTVSKEVIPSTLVDTKITTAVWNGGGELYEVYSIKNVWNYRQIAIKTKYGYLIANKAGKTQNIAVSS